MAKRRRKRMVTETLTLRNFAERDFNSVVRSLVGKQLPWTNSTGSGTWTQWSRETGV